MGGTRLLLIRHGATEANLRRPYTLQGLRPDPDLAEVGVMQARAVAVSLRGVPISVVYSSPMRRAWQTAQAIAGEVHVPLRVEPVLVEVDTGEWTGRTWAEIEREWPKEAQAFHEDAERFGYLGGENLGQVRDRVLPRVEGMLERHEEETIAVVSHGVVNRVLLANWLGIPLRFARRLSQDNTGVSVVEVSGGKVQVRTVNGTGHLGGLCGEAA